MNASQTNRSVRAQAATRRPARKRMTGTQKINEARIKREAAMATGITEEDYLDAIIASVAGLTVEAYRARTGR